MAKDKNRITPEYLTITQLAEFSGLGQRFLRNALKDPEHPLPHFRINHKTILVSKSEFAHWLEPLRVDPAGDLDNVVNLVLAGVRQ